ncbi:MAG: hypothetical protein U1E05_04145, partial [Patescibacteria group bacterium]|nr:hypothetical protein [Patescibacteria group bacterium]
VVVLLVSLVAGCADRLPTEYGRRTGAEGGASVNGTAVLADMFTAAGHRVFSWSALSPRLQEQADCIVWFPDDFSPPEKQVRNWLEDWLWTEPGRTLIYVGRDFDATTLYWRKVQHGLEGELLKKAAEQRRVAEADFRLERKAAPAQADCDWFQFDGGSPPREVRTLRGESDWLAGIDPKGLEIELHGRFQYPNDWLTEVVLSSEGDALVARRDLRGSRFIIVTNGSFLLNVPMVNHEHRKLAGRLVAEIGPNGQSVAFLESGPDGPPIRDDEPPIGAPTGLDIFTVWPTNWILLHLAAAGIVFCFARLPIFGRPRELPPPPNSDFGLHIDAVARLLERTGDRNHAATRILNYRENVRSRQE